eukprot:16260-Heterococcus_DN1.PRE.2
MTTAAAAAAAATAVAAEETNPCPLLYAVPQLLLQQHCCYCYKPSHSPSQGGRSTLVLVLVAAVAAAAAAYYRELRVRSAALVHGAQPEPGAVSAGLAVGAVKELQAVLLSVVHYAGVLAADAAVYAHDLPPCLVAESYSIALLAP